MGGGGSADAKAGPADGESTKARVGGSVWQEAARFSGVCSLSLPAARNPP